MRTTHNQKEKRKRKDLVRRRRYKENKGKKVPRLIVEAKLHGDAMSQCPSKPHPSASCLQNHNDDYVTMLTHMRVMRLGLQNNN
jgi:hypothetical protein